MRQRPDGLPASRDTGGVALRLSSTRLVGRHEELAELREALVDAGSGRPSLVLVSGEAGVGKTRLVQVLAETACADGVRVLRGACPQSGAGDLPYAPLVGALRDEVRAGTLDGLSAGTRAELGRLLPELAGGEPAEAGELGRARLSEALVTAIRALAADRPSMLVLEDLHWADGETRSLLAQLVPGLSDDRLLLVATVRDDELHRRHPLGPLLAALGRDPSSRRIGLARLTRDELAAQVEAIRGQPADAELLERLWRRSEGNPLFAEELLAAGTDGRGAVPATLRDALGLRTAGLDDAGRAIVRLLAVGGALDETVMAAAGRLEAPQVREGLREAIERGLIAVDGERFALRHALLGEAVADELLPGERLEVHAALADALAGRPDATTSLPVATALAHHRAAAGDRRGALEASVRAADLVGAAAAASTAAALLEQALELWPLVEDPAGLTGVDHVDLLRRAAAAQREADDRPRALALLERALEETDEEGIRDPGRPADVLVELARVLWHLARPREATAALDRALALLPAEVASAPRARVLAQVTHLRMLQSRHASAVDVGREAVAMATAVGDEHARRRARKALGVSLAWSGDVDDGLEVLRLAAGPDGRGAEREECVASVNLADVLYLAGRAEEALATLGALVDQVDGGWEYRWVTLAAVEILVRLGRLAEAKAWIGRGRPAMSGQGRLNDGLRVAELAHAVGDLPAARTALDGVREIAAVADEPQLVGAFAAVATVAALAEGDLDAAHAAVEDGVDRLETCAEDTVRFANLAALGARVSAARAQRDRDLGVDPSASVAEAELMVQRASAAAQTRPLPLERAWEREARAWLHEARGGATPEAWAAVADGWTALGYGPQAADATLSRAEACVRDGDRVAGATAAATAHERARSMGAAGTVARVEALAARARLDLSGQDGSVSATGAQPVAGDDYGLTVRERQVLGLVAGGATNREIGAALFMAEKTASVHVSRILAKLGVRGRTEAAALAHRRGLADAPGTRSVSAAGSSSR